jgi:hypothetical protein
VTLLRPAKLIAASGMIVVLAGLAALGYVLARPTTHGSLRLGGDKTDFCYQPPTPADWQAQVAHGLIFGLDYLELTTMSARLTVLSVNMIDPSGGLAITNVALVPGAGVAIGTDGNKPIVTAEPTLAKYAREVPAKLEITPEPPGAEKPWDPKGWQLAVTLRAPANAVKASMNGLKIIYRSGDVIRTLRTPDTVRIGTGKDICKY